MNRSIVLLGVGILLLAFALIAFPIVVTGAEQFDFEQEAGIYTMPPAFAVILIGAISTDPRATTVGGAFGNPEAEAEARRSSSARGPPAARPLGYNPREPVRCRYCGSIVTFELAQCPRCARARECRTCGRPLGIVLDRATCPACARPEALCNCPRVPLKPIAAPGRARRV
jgi:hypothetical protein